MIITSVDVGVSNFAFVKCEVEENEIVRVLLAERLDLAVVGACGDPACSLRVHGKTASSRLLHLTRDRPEILSCDLLLVEQQPIVGMKDVEQTLCALATSDVKLISPRSMHAHFRIGNLSYKERKKETVEIASPLIAAFLTEARKHDMADAMCILMYYLHGRRVDAEEKARAQESMEHVDTILQGRGYKSLSTFLDQFRFARQ
jgi:hypothetical protein